MTYFSQDNQTSWSSNFIFSTPLNGQKSQQLRNWSFAFAVLEKMGWMLKFYIWFDESVRVWLCGIEDPSAEITHNVHTLCAHWGPKCRNPATDLNLIQFYCWSIQTWREKTDRPQYMTGDSERITKHLETTKETQVARHRWD